VYIYIHGERETDKLKDIILLASNKNEKESKGILV
jgi:hypothetical protein